MVETAALRPGYARLLQTIADWAKVHDSIKAMFVSGSVAEGTADAFSDLDLVVVVNQPDFTALLDEVRTVINDVEPLVLDYRLRGQLLCLITEEWHRIDLVFGGSDSGVLDQVLIPVFDPDDLYEGAVSEKTPEPATADDLIKLVSEFLRVLGLSAVVHGRKDVHVGHEGADQKLGVMVCQCWGQTDTRTVVFAALGAQKSLAALAAGHMLTGQWQAVGVKTFAREEVEELLIHG